MEKRAIIGIDPGSRCTGYGIIFVDGNRLALVDCGEIRAYSKDDDFAQRLDTIYKGLSAVISSFSPDVAAVENLFFARNAMSALKLGHARGAAMLAAIHSGLMVHEYTPLEIKQSVTGYGRADKSQVQHMVKLLLNIKTDLTNDASDALAAAICHANSSFMANHLEKRLVI